MTTENGYYSPASERCAEQTWARAKQKRIEGDDLIHETRGTTLAEHEAYVGATEKYIQEQKKR